MNKILFMLCVFLTISPPIASAQFAKAPRCLEQMPVELDQCFAEFLAAGIKEKGVWYAFLQKHKDRLFYNQDSRQLRIHKERLKEEPLTEDLAERRKPKKETLLSAKERPTSTEVPYLSSGGWLNIVTLRFGVDGHSEVTDQVLDDEFKFDDDARALMSDASQDPDFYDWRTDSAHAQTPIDDTGRVKNREDSPNGNLARSDFLQWLARNVKQIRDYCNNDEIRFALYFLGYALHAVQDLAAHNGRTASEHAWNSYCNSSGCGGTLSPEMDPDDNNGNISLARKYTTVFLNLIDRFVGDTCWVKLRRYKGSLISKSEKETLLGKTGWDLSWSEYQKYKTLAPTFASLPDRNDNVVRWLQPQDEKLTALIEQLRRRIYE
jgi:hypothetical protein